MNGGARPAEVEAALLASFWKVLALLSAGVVVGVALTAKAYNVAYLWWRSVLYS